MDKYWTNIVSQRRIRYNETLNMGQMFDWSHRAQRALTGWLTAPAVFSAIFATHANRAGTRVPVKISVFGSRNDKI